MRWCHIYKCMCEIPNRYKELKKKVAVKFFLKNKFFFVLFFKIEEYRFFCLMYLFYGVIWFFFFYTNMTFFIAIRFFIYYFISYMCANEHSINHVNNFHYCDDDTVQDEMLLKSSRNKKYSQNIGPKRCFAY